MQRIAVAPLVVRAKPVAPVRKSCLRLKDPTGAKKKVHFQEYGGWNLHRVWPLLPDSPPSTIFTLAEVDLLHPSRYDSLGDDGPYRMVLPGHECRWPQLEEEPRYDGYESMPPSCCQACAQVSADGTLFTRFRYNQQTIRCPACQADPARRQSFRPPLDDNGEEDHLDTCTHSDHTLFSDTCGFIQGAYHADHIWRAEHFPNDIPT